LRSIDPPRLLPEQEGCERLTELIRRVVLLPRVRSAELILAADAVQVGAVFLVEP
jgi:hypothetical protein